MERQLPLLELKPDDWRLDERTREIGRNGLAAAREALRRATEKTTPGGDHHPRSRRQAA